MGTDDRSAGPRIATMVVDDDYLSRDLLRRFVEADPDCNLVGAHGNGAEAWEAIRRLGPDLLLLDIEMPSVDGLALARRLGDLPDPPQVLFVTAHEQHALQAFELEALDYLVKPLHRQRFEKAMQRAKAIVRTLATGRGDAGARPVRDDTRPDPDPTAFLLTRGDEVLRLTPPQISWAEAANQYVVLHTDHGDFVRAESLSSFARRLSARGEFLRVHRSALINATRVLKIVKRAASRYRIVLDCGAEIDLARSRRNMLDEILGNARPDAGREPRE